jgi:integrase
MDMLGLSMNYDLVSRFRRGDFNLRPSLPRYQEIWDPKIVLDYLSNFPDSELSALSKKCATLLALASCQRLSTLHSLSYQDVSFNDKQAVIRIDKLQKQSRPGFHQAYVTVDPFNDQKLCVVKCLKDYLQATYSLRLGNPELTSLFLTYGKPVKNASKDTISRWIKQIIHDAGVPSVFSAHSTRAASTSSMF